MEDNIFNSYLKEIKSFTSEILITSEELLEEQSYVPQEVISKIKDIGLFAISIPKEYGGKEFSMEEQVLLTFEFTQASAVFRSIFSTTIGLCSQALLDYGTEEQKNSYLPGMAKGDIIGAFALTEPEAGSDAGSLKTTALKKGNGYILNGKKRYITNAPLADVFLVMARTDPKSTGSEGISAFLVDSKTQGIEVEKPPKMLGQKGSLACEITFKDVFVSAEDLVGGVEGNGLKAALRGINHARTHVAATCVGQAIRLINEMIPFALNRKQFDVALADMPTIQNMIADSYVDMNAAKSMTLEAARLFDTGSIPSLEISSAKYFASEMVSRVADNALQILGGAGYMENNVITRMYRDTRLFRLYEGTSQIQQRTIARALVKKQRER